ncbi:MAG: hypothetical protein SOV62_00380 [Alloprevotella sp.]|nr:hypothetical protein [Alloprevotella sp.]
MLLKTYGVSGLMDWTTQLKVGKGCVTVHFTGGALTAYGVTPAKYQTSNEFFQRVIECSDDFKSGRIKLLGVTELSGECCCKTKVVKKSAASSNTKVVKKSDASSVPDVVVPGAADDGVQEDGVDADGGGVVEDGVEADVVGVVDADGVRLVEVSDRYEAVQYLKEHCDGGLTMAKLRTKEAFEEAQKRFGVRFVFPQ